MALMLLRIVAVALLVSNNHCGATRCRRREQVVDAAYTDADDLANTHACLTDTYDDDNEPSNTEFTGDLKYICETHDVDGHTCTSTKDNAAERTDRETCTTDICEGDWNIQTSDDKDEIPDKTSVEEVNKREPCTAEVCDSDGSIPSSDDTDEKPDKNIAEEVKDGSDGEPLSSEQQVPGVYGYPKLSRVDPGSVGDVVDIQLQGVLHKRITRAVQPPIFEIPNFLTDEECDYVKQTAAKAGLEQSGLLGEDITQYNQRNWSEIPRISDQTWLWKQNFSPEFWGSFLNRVSELTQLETDVVERSEAVQVVKYLPGGHYHAHLDSDHLGKTVPCCFQTDCGSVIHTQAVNECCRICRYITVLIFLQDVEEGGETAFPLADMDDTLLQVNGHDIVDTMERQIYINSNKFMITRLQQQQRRPLQSEGGEPATTGLAQPEPPLSHTILYITGEGREPATTGLAQPESPLSQRLTGRHPEERHGHHVVQPSPGRTDWLPGVDGSAIVSRWLRHH